jgi:hypothetical protein
VTAAAIRHIAWDTVIACAISTLLIIGSWIFASGQMNGKTEQRLQAIEQRQDADEVKTSEQLRMISDGLAAVDQNVTEMRLEQCVLHRGELACANLVVGQK